MVKASSTRKRRRKTEPAPRTIVRPMFAADLPIGIYRDGKLLRVVELEDPRNGYMRAFNDIGVGGLSAGPVTGPFVVAEGGAA